MKRVLWIIVAMCSISIQPAFAAKEKSEDVKRAEMKKLVEEKKAELNGSQWEVAMTASDAKGKPDSDTWTFQNGQVSSKNLLNKGFTATNYTITIPEGDEMAVWETMQTSPKEGVVFIRGEWKGDVMRGMISQQMEGGNTRDYSFATTAKTAVPPSTVQEKKEEPVVAPVAEELPVEASADAGAAAVVEAPVAPAEEVAAAPVAEEAPVVVNDKKDDSSKKKKKK